MSHADTIKVLERHRTELLRKAEAIDSVIAILREPTASAAPIAELPLAKAAVQVNGVRRSPTLKKIGMLCGYIEQNGPALPMELLKAAIAAGFKYRGQEQNALVSLRYLLKTSGAFVKGADGRWNLAKKSNGQFDRRS